MKKEALFSDGTGNFVVPAEPKAFETVRLRFRTAKDDVDFVRVIAGAEGFVMRKAYTRGEFDYYVRALIFPKECMGEQYEEVIKMIHTHMPPSKVKIRHIH